MIKFWTKWSGLIKDGVIAVLVYILLLVTSYTPVISLLASVQGFLEARLFGVGNYVITNMQDQPWLTYYFAPLSLFVGIIFIFWLIEQDKKKKKK
jgi:preprotein translocase subunit SecY